MSPHPTILLGLVLCLGQRIHTQAGALPRPSISAEPGSVIPRGQPVTVVCRGPAGVESFRLENKDNRGQFKDKRSVSQLGPHQTEARFPIAAVREDDAWHYQCIYVKDSCWSEPSEPLKLVVTDQAPDAGPPDPSLPGETQVRPQDKSSPGLTEHVYILIGVSVAFLLCLLLLVLLLLYRQHRRKRGPPRSKGEEQRPQERLSPGADIPDGTPDLASVDRLPEDGEADGPTPAAGGPQEVTYAQLDHQALTQRAVRAGSLPFTEPTAASSTYAAISRH
ncbi:leukocyte-associated immunoglobulin-like receptor 1 [Hippopotamus amphibius kiboko]|uniref:leukocyte-associated immunoglobulin-like receptor 1 n=1 Tax=Hippopotamus amphibius kiboko TaxID=575201 RepID=UPI00259458AF|nr:leukocyte-associated immunoglobulin-like receptor 1 [Hippopotamus amphibius kiboko]